MNTENLTKKFAGTATGRQLANKMTDIMGEGVEEAAGEFIRPFLRRAFYDKNAANASAGDLLNAAANGALVSAVLGAADMGSNIALHNKTKQDTVYAAYATELDRQIQQQMAKQSANSLNNKISAGSPHNIEKTSENNYNVNKEGVEDVRTDDRRKTAKFNEEIPSVQQNRTADNTEPRRAQGDESGTTAKVSGRTRVKRKDVVFEYTALQENEISDNTKIVIKHLEKFGIEAVAFKGQTVADTSEGIDTLEENESGALGVGFIPVGNELELHGIEAAGHEVEHEFFRQNIPEAVEFHNLVLSKMKEDSRYTKAFERQLKRLGYAEESFPNEKPAFISGWIYSTQYGNNVEFSKELLDYYSKAFDDFEDIVVAHKKFIDSVTVN